MATFPGYHLLLCKVPSYIFVDKLWTTFLGNLLFWDFPYRIRGVGLYYYNIKNNLIHEISSCSHIILFFFCYLCGKLINLYPRALSALDVTKLQESVFITTLRQESVEFPYEATLTKVISVSFYFDRNVLASGNIKQLIAIV